MKIVKFHTNSCVPCANYAPVFDKTMEKFPDIEVERIDADANPDRASEYRIMSVPTTIIIGDDGMALFQGLIPMTEEELTETINLHLKK